MSEINENWINLPQGLDIGSTVSVDKRLVLSKTEMRNISDDILPTHYFAICNEDGLLYIYDKSLPEDPYLGKYREASNFVTEIKVNGASVITGGGSLTNQKVALIDVPTKVSQIANDSNFIKTEDVEKKYSTIDKAGSKIVLDVDSTNYIVKASLYNDKNIVISQSSIDLPFEDVIVNGRYDSTGKSLILTRRDGSIISIDISPLITGLATENYVDNQIVQKIDQLKTTLYDKDTIEQKLSLKQNNLIAGGSNVHINNSVLTVDGVEQATETKLGGVRIDGETIITNELGQIKAIAQQQTVNWGNIDNKPFVDIKANGYLKVSETDRTLDVNVPSVPAAASDIVNKAYVDSVKNELDTHTSNQSIHESIGTIKAQLSTVASTGKFTDLINYPTATSKFLNDGEGGGSPFATQAWVEEHGGGGGGKIDDVKVNGTSVVTNKVANIDLTPYKKSSELATVATSGNYNDLTNKPALSNYATKTDLLAKQDLLTPGTNIEITNNVISAKSGLTKNSMTVGAAVGDYNIGDVIPEGTDVLEIIRKILSATVAPRSKYFYYGASDVTGTQLNLGSLTRSANEATLAELNAGKLITYSTDDQYANFAYPKEFGQLTEAKDDDGDDCLNLFNIYSITYNEVEYYLYSSKEKLFLDNFNLTYKI